MKTIATLTALLAGIGLTAQTADFRITVTKDQYLSTAFWINTMNVEFSPAGSHFTDNMDQTVLTPSSAFIYPYTIDSALVPLLATDSRPELRSQLTVPFGVWSTGEGDMHVQGAWVYADDSLNYDVILTDNQTGLSYDMYNENVFQVAYEVGYNNRFQVTFVPKVRLLSFNESCFGQGNGSVYAHSAQPSWTLHMYENNVYTGAINVSGTDTLIQHLGAGNYEFIYELDNNMLDTVMAVITSPAAVVSVIAVDDPAAIENVAVDFTNSSTGAMDYYWDFGDGFTSITASPSHAYAIAGTYTVTLTAYNAMGCDNSSTYTITVTAPPMAPQPHLVDRNNAPANNTQRNGDVNVNAENGQANITPANEIEIASLTVYSLTGQVLYSGSGNENTFHYETPGVYVAHIVYINGSESSKQLLLN